MLNLSHQPDDKFIRLKAMQLTRLIMAKLEPTTSHQDQTKLTADIFALLEFNLQEFERESALTKGRAP